MKEKIKTFISSVALRRTRALIILAGMILAVVATGVSAFYLVIKNDSIKIADEESTSKNLSEIDSIVAVVGAEDSSIIGNTKSNNSWPGEIISSGNVEVQPQREGTIVEWKVNIGQKVRQGQVLARLSAPPATPELTRALAEQAQSLTRAKATAEAQATFVEKNKEQLIALRTQIVNSGKQISDSLSNGASSDRSQSLATLQASLDASRRDVDIKAQIVKDYSLQAIRKVFQAFTNYSADPITRYKQYPQNFYFTVKYGLGSLNWNTQTDFSRDLVEAVKASLNSEDAIGEKTMKFLQSSDALVANSYFVDGSTEGLITLRNIVSDERAELSEKITELSEAKTETRKIESELAAKKTDFSLSAANSSKETAEKLKDIDEKLIDLDRQLQLASAEAEGAGVAYYTISNALTGGLNITAPRAGIVSIIMKKPGEFVGPGMPVATVTAKGNDRVLVRMSIPNNIQKPEVGEVLSIIRPGFGTDVQKVRLVGIGSSLNDGSYMADAVFTEETEWPIGASVRVLAPTSSSPISIKYSSILWSEGGAPTIWAISEADRIFVKKITIGRTLGTLIEVYDGLKNGDRYIANPSQEIKENMFLGDLIKISTPKENDTSAPAKSGGHGDEDGEGH